MTKREAVAKTKSVWSTAILCNGLDSGPDRAGSISCRGSLLRDLDPFASRDASASPDSDARRDSAARPGNENGQSVAPGGQLSKANQKT